ncbi:YopX family protein [Streptococcus suis]|uniref:YopX family protein n=1 Tax=Streptococcus suis TaxID=1307 RepID=UPI003F8AD7D6
MVVPKFRVWDTVKKAMSEVQAIVYTEERVYPFYSKVVRRYIPFSEAILMQSTGLFDVNGKEIFEGDVVKFNDTWAEHDYEGYVDGASEGENFTEIIKTEDGFSFGRTKIPESSLFDFLNDEHMKFSEIVKSDDFNMVIIGNIYENPELLEG